MSLTYLEVIPEWEMRSTSGTFQGSRSFLNILSCPALRVFGQKEKSDTVSHPEDELLNLRIEPAGNEVLNFSEGYHFPWGKGKRVYIKLYFVGKKPVVKRLGK